MSKVLEAFGTLLETSLDEKGYFPQPGIVLAKDGGLEIVALDLNAGDIINWFWNTVTIKEAQEVIFGIDRTTKPGQGTEFADVLTCAHWEPSLHESWSRSFRIGVVNYQWDPRIVRPIDWDNEWWKTHMAGELLSRVPPFRLKVQEAS